MENSKKAILLLIFNRIEPTKRVIDEINKYKPDKLYVACDGWRNDTEKVKVLKTRDYVCLNNNATKVFTHFRDSNLGCKMAVSDGINWFFENEEMGIILEDDCIPSMDFFRFCEFALERFKDEQKIFHIDGSNFGTPTNKSLMHFSNYALIWGWASWRRAWKYYDIEMKDYPEKKNLNFLKDIFNTQEINYWIPKLDSVYDNKVDTWDYQWFYSIWKNKALTVRPDRNLIKNIGFDSDATHTKKTNRLLKNIKLEELDFSLNTPSELIVNKKLDDEISFKRFNIGKSIFERFIQKFF